MVRTKTLAIAASVSFILAACGDAGPSSQSAGAESSSAASAEQTTNADTSQDEPSEEATSEDAVAADDEDAEAESESGGAEETRDTMDSEKSPRGNLIKKIGETASVATEGGEGDVLVEFAITDVATNADCTNEYADEPANGNFVVVTIEATTMPELAEQEYMTSWGFNPYDFHIVGDDGKRENDSTGTAYSCLSESESLPFEIGPGQTVEGKVALDSAYEKGVLVYVPGSVGAGWEWEFGE